MVSGILGARLEQFFARDLVSFPRHFREGPRKSMRLQRGLKLLGPIP